MQHYMFIASTHAAYLHLVKVNCPVAVAVNGDVVHFVPLDAEKSSPAIPHK